MNKAADSIRFRTTAMAEHRGGDRPRAAGMGLHGVGLDVRLASRAGPGDLMPCQLHQGELSPTLTSRPAD